MHWGCQGEPQSRTHTHIHTDTSFIFAVYSCGFLWQQKYIVEMDGKASPNVSLFGFESLSQYAKDKFNDERNVGIFVPNY